MTRAITVLATIAALAVSAAPVASARIVGKPKQGAIIYNGHAGLGANHSEGTVRGINAAGGWDPLRRTGKAADDEPSTPGAVHAGGAQVIETMSVDYT